MFFAFGISIRTEISYQYYNEWTRYVEIAGRHRIYYSKKPGDKQDLIRTNVTSIIINYVHN